MLYGGFPCPAAIGSNIRVIDCIEDPGLLFMFGGYPNDAQTGTKLVADVQLSVLQKSSIPDRVRYNLLKRKSFATGKKSVGPRLKSFAANLTLVLGSLILACGISEALIRLLVPQQLILKRPDVWQPVDGLGWVHRAGIATTINTGERTVDLYTDTNGFRIGRAGRVRASRRILLLGDSFAEAFQVEYEQSFSGLLEQWLQQQFKEPVAVDNTAVGGWNPNQYLLQAKKSLERESYGLVIVMLFLGNDIIGTRKNHYPARSPAAVHPFRFPRSLNRRELINTIFYPINDFFEVRSHLFIFVKTKIRVLLMRFGLTAAYFPKYFLKREVNSERWQVTVQVCREISDLAKKYGTPTFVVLIPTAFQVSPNQFDEHLRGFRIDPQTVDIYQPNRLIAASLEAEALDFFDTLPALQEAHGNCLKLYGDIDSHFTPEGHAVVTRVTAPLVLQRLKDMRLLDGVYIDGANERCT